MSVAWQSYWWLRTEYFVAACCCSHAELNTFFFFFHKWHHSKSGGWRLLRFEWFLQLGDLCQENVAQQRDIFLSQATTSVIWHSVDFHSLHPSKKRRLCFIEEWYNMAAHSAHGVSDSRSWGLQQKKKTTQGYWLSLNMVCQIPQSMFSNIHLRVFASTAYNYCCIPVIHP